MPSFTLADGVNLAMRMPPYYLIVVEVRDGFAAEAMMSALQSGHAFERIANLMGNARQVPMRDATIATAESIDFIVQIRFVQEVQRLTDIARVEKELRNGLPWCTSVFGFAETPS